MFVTSSPIQKTESFIHIQALAIRACGWKVTVATGGEESEARTIDGITYVASPLPAPERPRHILARIRRLVSTVLARNREPTPVRFRQSWVQIIRDANPDLIFVQFGPTAARILPVLRATRIPFAIQFHGYDATALLRHWGYRLTMRHIVRRSAVSFGCSAFLAAEVARIARPADRSRIHVVSPGFDGDTFNFSPRGQQDAAGEPVRLLSVARLVEGKGHHLMLQALARCTTDATLDIIGDGEERGGLEGLAEQLGISDRVKFLGHQPHTEIVAGMRKADIFVQASTTAQSGWREGLGLSSVEAAATGLPVIVTNSGGLAETCCADSGLVVPDGDIAALADAIDTLANDPDLRIAMGQHGARFVRQHFLSNVQAKIAVAHFSDCLASAR